MKLSFGIKKTKTSKGMDFVIFEFFLETDRTQMKQWELFHRMLLWYFFKFKRYSRKCKKPSKSGQCQIARFWESRRGQGRCWNYHGSRRERHQGNKGRRWGEAACYSVDYYKSLGRKGTEIIFLSNIYSWVYVVLDKSEQSCMNNMFYIIYIKLQSIYIKYIVLDSFIFEKFC